jgi:exodeoxyribonuclease VII small subunit
MSSSEPQTATFEEVLARLEDTLARLADGSAPLDELVAAHQRAASLLSEAEARLEALKERAGLLVRSLQATSPERIIAPAPKR